MELAKEAISEIIEHIRKVSEEISGEQVNRMVHDILYSRRIFVYGAGRSMLVGKAFAMRLAHLGLNVHIVGDTITPAIKPGDMLFSISGSGGTSSIVMAAEAAKNAGAKIVSVTSNPDSRLGKISDTVVVVKGRTKIDNGRDYLTNQITGRDRPLSPMGTLFEDTCQVFLDGVIVELMNRLGKTENDMKNLHANIE